MDLLHCRARRLMDGPGEEPPVWVIVQVLDQLEATAVELRKVALDTA